MERNGLVKIIIIVIVGFMVIKTCSRKRTVQTYTDDRREATTSEWKNTPVKNIVDSLSSVQNFSIVLSDMNANGDTYQHKYQLIVEKPDTVLADTTQWYTVTDTYFNQHMDDLGMEVLSKKDGSIQEQVAPAGYTHFIGDQQYGRWVDRGGSTFWEFYGKYAFMSSLFNLMAYPVRRPYYNTYYRSYYGTGRPYYGPGSARYYGTGTYTSSSAGRNTTWANKPSDFKSQVRNRVSRSAASSSRSYSSGSQYGKTSRSSSRSSSSTSYRSRSGGFGK